MLAETHSFVYLEREDDSIVHFAVVRCWECISVWPGFINIMAEGTIIPGGVLYKKQFSWKFSKGYCPFLS